MKLRLVKVEVILAVDDEPIRDVEPADHVHLALDEMVAESSLNNYTYGTQLIDEKLVELPFDKFEDDSLSNQDIDKRYDELNKAVEDFMTKDEEGS